MILEQQRETTRHCVEHSLDPLTRVFRKINCIFLIAVLSLLGTNLSNAQSVRTCGNDVLVLSGNIDYKAIGNSMNYSEARDNCNKKSNSSASLSIPSGASIRKAYLQWSGSGSVDSRVSLNGHSVSAQKTFTDRNSTQYYFGAYADVTNLVQGSGNYTVSNLTWSNSYTYCQPNSAYGAWSLVVVYEQSNLEDCTIHLLQNNFNFSYPEGTYNSTIGCINPSACTSDAELTIITFESDNYKGEHLYIGGQYYGDNNFRGRTAPNLDIYTADVSNLIGENTSSLSYSIRSYSTNTVWGRAIEGLFDFVKILKYNNCPPDPCANAGGDSDGDGVCNDDDCQPNNANFPAIPGTACNDGNPNTVNDVIQANGCDCAGTFDACATSGGDSDGDGVCNDDDCQPNNANFPATPGTACNDGNPNTVNDVIQANGCDCAGTFDACATSGGDSDGDGVCNDDDCQPNNANFPATPGTACNDGNPNTVNDVIQANGCDCAGTFDACATSGGDSDGDGVCNDDDCQPNNANFPATPGTACNDGNPNTINDVITADGCGCAGTPDNNNPDCNEIVFAGGDKITVSNLTAPITIVKVFNSGWQEVAGCSANCSEMEMYNVPAGTYYVTVQYFTEVWQPICKTDEYVTVTGGGNPCDNVGGDTDGDGVCNNDDCRPNDANFPATPGTACNDGNPNTVNDVVTADGCGCAGTTPEICANKGGDSDGDGVCNDDDCQPNNANFPATPGTACNDGNPNTVNDVITADGCGCAGTPDNNNPDCNEIVFAGGDKITVSNLTAPITIVKVFNSGWQEVAGCSANCSEMEMYNVPAGTYYVTVQYFTEVWQPICKTDEYVTVTGGGNPCDNAGGDTDGDGVCNDDDCRPNDANFPATPGTACNDGNPNTVNDVVTADGCGCAGTTPEICANKGGDSDGDGVCNDDDCQPNNANFPATPGTACNDGNPNTINDVITADGCGCAGTPDNNNPDCNEIVFAGGDKITVSNLTAPITIVKVFNSGWQEVAGCSANCSEMEMYNVPAGTYYVTVQYFTEVWQPICKTDEYVTVTGGGNPCDNAGGDTDGDGVCNDDDCRPNDANFPATPGMACNDGNPNTVNDVVTADGCGCAGTTPEPCATSGGDSDGDGVCNDDDCQPNNANFPATPGTACNDGNPNTINDVITADGCGCAGTPVPNECTPTTLVKWDLNACASCSNGSNADWQELVPTIVNESNCFDVNATGLRPTNNGDLQSCTPGQSGSAVCINVGTTIKFSVNLNGNDGGLSGLSFYEKAPNTYVWTSPNNSECSGEESGYNNRPSKFDLKIYKNGSLIYSKTNQTQTNWNLRTFDFSGDSDFDIDGNTTFRFELRPYSTLSSGNIKAWDIDEIQVQGCCSTPSTGGSLTVDCPNNINVTQNVTEGRNVSWTAPTGNTTCSGGVQVTQTEGPSNGAIFPVGTTSVSYRISDNCGNVRTCTFSVTVAADNNSGGGSGGHNYCSTRGTNPWIHWIKNVRIGTINQTSNKEGYADFTHTNTHGYKGSDIDVNLTAGFSYTRYNMHWQIWVDWNHDGDFDDADEMAMQQASSNDNVSGHFRIPQAALGGTTCVRVVCRRDEYGSSCGDFSNGEVEDYTLIVDEGSPTPLVAAGTNNSISVFPNPAQSVVNVDLTTFADQEVTVTIFDNTGRRVVDRYFEYASAGTTKLDVDDLAAGLYLIKVQTATEQYTERLVVNRR